MQILRLHPSCTNQKLWVSGGSQHCPLTNPNRNADAPSSLRTAALEYDQHGMKDRVVHILRGSQGSRGTGGKGNEVEKWARARLGRSFSLKLLGSH